MDRIEKGTSFSSPFWIPVIIEIRLAAVRNRLLSLRQRDGKLYAGRAPASFGDYAVKWTDTKGKEHRIEARSGTLFVDGREYKGEGIG